MLNSPLCSELITVVKSLDNLHKLLVERYQRLIVLNLFIKSIITKPN